MIALTLEQELPFVTGELSHQGKIMPVRLLVDTGSATTLLSVERLESVGQQAMGNEPLFQVFGVGGSEWVYETQVDRLAVGDLAADDFTVEAGALDYGLNLDGIVGMSFLLATRVVIDLANLTISAAE